MSDARTRLEQQLEDIDRAISDRLRGIGHLQAFSGAGKSTQYVPLGELYAARERIQAELRKSGGPKVARPTFKRRDGR